jgi:hypothetical protein
MYYLYYDGTELQVIESELGAVLTTRLLLHAQLTGTYNTDFKVYGCVDPENISWFTEVKPPIHALGSYIEPKIFTDDKDNKYWALLSSEDAKRLLAHWKNLSRYTDKVPDKVNYFKNAVDHFEWQMEKKWYKQTK